MSFSGINKIKANRHGGKKQINVLIWRLWASILDCGWKNGDAGYHNFTGLQSPRILNSAQLVRSSGTRRTSAVIQRLLLVSPETVLLLTRATVSPHIPLRSRQRYRPEAAEGGERVQRGTAPQQQKNPRKQQGTEDRGQLGENPKPERIYFQTLRLI